MSVNQQVMRLKHERKLIFHLSSVMLLLIFSPFLYQPSLFAQTSSTADSAGFLHLESNSKTTFYTIINDDFSNPHKIDTRDSLALSPGIYNIRIIKKLHKDVALQTRIETNKVNRYNLNFGRLKIEDLPNDKHLSSFPRLELRTKNAIRTDHDTHIYINGERIGTGFAILSDEHHKHVDLTLQSNSGQELKKRLTLDNNTPFELHEHFTRPRQSTSVIYSFVPGLSQLYKRQKIKAGVIIGSQVALSLSAYYFHRKMNSTFTDLEVTRATYDASIDPEKIQHLAGEMIRLDQNVSHNFKLRNTFIGAGLALYFFNVLDGAFRTEDGFRKNISFDPYFDLSENRASLQLSVKF